MKIYTKTGDDGRTALFGGGRVSKDDVRVEAYGTVDELNAVLGWCATRVADPSIVERIEAIQHDLFSIGSVLATPKRGDGPTIPDVPEERVAQMEAWMDAVDEELPALKSFVLPGGTEGGASLHVARTVCRRAERAVVRLSEAEPVEEGVTVYLNRLSDLLFTFARVENHRAGHGDVLWRKPEAR